MNNDEWPSDAPRDAYYWTLGGTVVESESSAEFERRYGKPPEFIFDYKGHVRLGPVRNQEGKDVAQG